MKKLILLILAMVLTMGTGEKFRFDNYTLYKVTPQNMEQINLLLHLQEHDVRFDFWNDLSPYSEFVNIMSSPKDKIELENFLNENNMKMEIVQSNIQEAIDKESVVKYTRSNVRNMTWNAYYNLDSIYSWLDDLIATYPDVASSITGGTSYEQRAIKGIKISHGNGRRGIFLEGGIHSREWISPATVCYITYQLLTSNDEETIAAARDFDWYIFPVTNPDGYVFTHNSFRLWRKNRRPIGSEYGVDLNRNWDNNFMAFGASSNPASDTYAGPEPFSEPETKSLAAYIRSVGSQIDLYLSFHSYGQLLLIPFGNTTTPVGNYHEAINVGRRAMGALSVRYGTQYVTGNIAEAIYLATGGSVDWVKEALNIPLVYCYELRDRSTFILPETQILPNCEETMDSLLEMIHQAKRYGHMHAVVTAAAEHVHLSVMMIFFGFLFRLFYN